MTVIKKDTMPIYLLIKDEKQDFLMTNSNLLNLIDIKISLTIKKSYYIFYFDYFIYMS